MRAGQRTDVKSSIVSGKPIFCLCDKAKCCETIDYSDSRGYSVEKVRCKDCSKTWTRMNIR